MKECTTHHHACDCREEAISRLVKAARSLMLESGAFIEVADPANHGRTNINVMNHWVLEVKNALVAFETEGEMKKRKPKDRFMIDGYEYQLLYGVLLAAEWYTDYPKRRAKTNKRDRKKVLLRCIKAYQDFENKS